MDFLLRAEGLIYNLPALLFLTYFLWARPGLGVVIALLAGVRVLGPIAGLAQWIPFSVHMTLVGAAALAGTRPVDDAPADLLLVVGAGGIGLLTSYFYLWRWTAPQPWLLGLLVGLALGILYECVPNASA